MISLEELREQRQTCSRRMKISFVGAVGGTVGSLGFGIEAAYSGSVPRGLVAAVCGGLAVANVLGYSRYNALGSALYGLEVQMQAPDAKAQEPILPTPPSPHP